MRFILYQSYDETWEGIKCPQLEGMGENTPFSVQSRKKERDNGRDSIVKEVQHRDAKSDRKHQNTDMNTLPH